MKEREKDRRSNWKSFLFTDNKDKRDKEKKSWKRKKVWIEIKTDRIKKYERWKSNSIWFIFNLETNIKKGKKVREM